MSDAPGWLFSVDWRDKLIGFHNSTFPVGIYGCMGTFSRYMDFISVWDSNPPTIGLRYIQHLFETKRLTFNIRMDCGTETGKLAAIHAFLCDNRDDVDDSTDLVIYGLCNNQQDKTVEGFAWEDGGVLQTTVIWATSNRILWLKQCHKP